jgi:hypothetical protein
MSLNGMALSAIQAGEGESIFAAVCLMVLGYLAALWLRRHHPGRIARLPYLFWSGIAACLMGLSSYWGLLVVAALTHDLLWLWLAGLVVAFCGYGYFVGCLGRARALDAYGSARNSWMGLVPIANFILMIKPADDAVPRGKQPWMALGVFGSLVLYALAPALGEYGAQVVTDQAQQISPAQAEALEGGRLRAMGVDLYLQSVVRDTRTYRLDPVMLLLRAEQEGQMLRYVLQVTKRGYTVTQDGRDAVVADVCATPHLRELMVAGAQLEYLYLGRKLEELARFGLTAADCPV